MMVRNCVLPPALQRALKSGVWTERGRPKDGVWTDARHKALICAVVNWKYDARLEPVLYDLKSIEGNAAFWDNPVAEFLGTPHPSIVPATADPERTLFIGEMDADCPIALDYRTSPPSVILFDIDLEGMFWKQVAVNIEDLLERLEMEV